MNLNQLRVFFVAAREGSYTRAAEILFVTQPAVSQSIHALEGYYGVGLFKRVGRNMELTSAGRLLYDYAERIFTLSDEAERALREVGAVGRGELRVAASKIFARYVLPSLVDAFRQRHPSIDVVVDEGSSEQMVKSVEQLVNHIAVVGRMPYPPRIRSLHFRQVDLVLVAGSDHPLAERACVSWKELNDETFVIRERGASSRLAVFDRFVREGVSPKIALESGSVGFIKEFVAAGRGLAFLYEPEIKAELEAGQLKKIPLAEGDLVLETDIVMLSEAVKTPAVRAFLAILEESRTASWSVLPVVQEVSPAATSLPG
jgi:DNA-binding transcriptional LysR family regulator